MYEAENINDEQKEEMKQLQVCSLYKMRGIQDDVRTYQCAGNAKPSSTIQDVQLTVDLALLMSRPAAEGILEEA